jgi:putative membrane protein
MTQKSPLQPAARMATVAVLLLAASFGGTVAAVVAQTTAPAPARPMAATHFVNAMWLANQQEIADGQYVIQRTKDSNVRRFAQGMIDDHSTANVSLLAAARSAGVSARITRPAPSSALRSHSGSQLDTAYMSDEITSHRRVLAFVRNEETYGTPPALRTYASNLAPIVGRHLDSAIAYVTAKQLGLSTNSMPNPAARAPGP